MQIADLENRGLLSDRALGLRSFAKPAKHMDDHLIIVLNFAFQMEHNF